MKEVIHMSKKSRHKHMTRKKVDACLSNFYTMLEEEAARGNLLSKRRHPAQSKQNVKLRPGISSKSLNNMLTMLAESDD